MHKQQETPSRVESVWSKTKELSEVTEQMERNYSERKEIMKSDIQFLQKVNKQNKFIFKNLFQICNFNVQMMAKQKPTQLSQQHHSQLQCYCDQQDLCGKQSLCRQHKCPLMTFFYVCVT